MDRQGGGGIAGQGHLGKGPGEGQGEKPGQKPGNGFQIPSRKNLIKIINKTAKYHREGAKKDIFLLQPLYLD
jgi:hypothetical protein